jgi:hypothetical protein
MIFSGLLTGYWIVHFFVEIFCLNSSLCYRLHCCYHLLLFPNCRFVTQFAHLCVLFLIQHCSCCITAGYSLYCTIRSLVHNHPLIQRTNLFVKINLPKKLASDLSRQRILTQTNQDNRRSPHPPLKPSGFQFLLFYSPSMERSSFPCHGRLLPIEQ